MVYIHVENIVNVLVYILETPPTIQVIYFIFLKLLQKGTTIFYFPFRFVNQLLKLLENKFII